ncbi:hypothetical protein [Candidatus Thiodiazotropha endoloripes]|uniref:hypothetical protein n=1 Tax=Candidatus Thiodiazotropha endoloripes TaxID=1818881 RepID=UPI001111E9AC|nr:hypothetical protein [Candidatus Thiodiazotropha endoloripes]
MNQTTQTANFAGFEASDAELQAVIGPVPPGADSDGRSTSIDYMKPIPGSEQSNLGAFLAAPDQAVRTRDYGQSAPDDAPLLVGGSGVDFGPRIGVIDYFKIIGGGIASFIPEGVRDFEYSRIVAESSRLSAVDNLEYDGIDDYSVGNGKGWTLSLPSYDDVKAGFGKAYNALAATFGEGQNAPNVSNLEYHDIDSYPEDIGSGSRLSIPTGGELVDFANAMYGRSLSASNAYRAEIEKGEHFRAGLAWGSDPMAQGLGMMVGAFGMTRPISATSRLGPSGASTAHSAFNANRLSQDLHFREASSVFDDAGLLTSETIGRSRIAVRGEDIGNPYLREYLPSLGGDLSEWAKYTTPTIKSPSGPFQLHFYRNEKLDLNDFSSDYKSIFNHDGDWNKNLQQWRINEGLHPTKQGHTLDGTSRGF